MNVYIDRDKLYNKLSSLFDGWLEWFKDENMSVRYAKQKILPIIMEEIPIDVGKELKNVQRNATNDLIKELREIIPEALWDKTAEELSNDQCYSLWQYCLESIREMKESWEAENGSNLVWVPGHYEEVKDE